VLTLEDNFGIIILDIDNNSSSRQVRIGGRSDEASPDIASTRDTNTGIFWDTEDGIHISTAGSTRVSVDNTSVTTTLPFKVPNGTASAPSLTFDNDTNTGLYRIGDDNLGISCNGTKQVDITTSLATFTNNVQAPAFTNGGWTVTSGGNDMFLNTGATSSEIFLRPNGSGSTTGEMGLNASNAFLRQPLYIGTTTAISGTTPLQIESGSSESIRMRNSSSSAGKHWRIGPENTASTFIIYNQDSAGVYIADGGTAWVSNSSVSVKKNLEDIVGGIGKVKQIRCKLGHYSNEDNTKRKRPFILAEDIQSVLPEAVYEKDGVLGVAYTELIPLLIKSIQELAEEVEELKKSKK